MAITTRGLVLFAPHGAFWNLRSAVYGALGIKAVNRVKEGKKEAPEPLVSGASLRISDAGYIRQAVDPCIR